MRGPKKPQEVRIQFGKKPQEVSGILYFLAISIQRLAVSNLSEIFPRTERNSSKIGARDSLLFDDFDTKVGRLQFVRDFFRNGKKLVENRRQRFSIF